MGANNNNHTDFPFSRRRILIVDDDTDFAESLGDILDLNDYTFAIAQNVDELTIQLDTFNPHIALIDIRLGQENGIDLIPIIRKKNSQTLCVMMTAYAHVETAIKALQNGAYDYLRKPIEGNELMATLERCYEKLKLEYDKETSDNKLYKLQRAVDQSIDGVAIADMDGTLQFINNSWLFMHGYESEKGLVGKQLSIFHTDEQMRNNVQPFNSLVRRNGFNQGEIGHKKKNGTSFPTWMSVTLLKNQNNQPAGLLAITHDITYRKKAEEELKHQKNELDIRVKELNCLFAISNLMNKPNISLHEIFQKTVEIIPQALQYPEATCAKISVENYEVCTQICNKNKFCLKDSNDRSQLIVGHILSATRHIIGRLDVGYRQEIPNNLNPSFQEEEYRLVHAVSELIGNIIEKKNTEEGLEKSLKQIQVIMEGIIQAMALTSEMRDPYTAGHQRRVSKLASAIAVAMQLAEDEIDSIRLTGLIHDLGKIYVPAEILSKPGKISDIEFSIIKTHAQVGHDILEKIDFPLPIAKIVHQHHERLDGSGYPLGLKGVDISLEAKIVSVADTVEAMASHRPYRAALGIDKALEEINKNAGKLYDAEAVEACNDLFIQKGFSFE
ncbi:MAG: response regulator [Candidatus Omnitrophica bacterium]|nr:response regulator [Candidatus Omnitrophota bacterium]